MIVGDFLYPYFGILKSFMQILILLNELLTLLMVV